MKVFRLRENLRHGPGWVRTSEEICWSSGLWTRIIRSIIHITKKCMHAKNLSTLFAFSPHLIQPLPFHQRMHNQSLPIRHRGNRNIPIKLEGFTHTCAKGDVGDLAVGLDLGEDGGEGGVGCGEVGGGFGCGKQALERVFSIYKGKRLGGLKTYHSQTHIYPGYKPGTSACFYITLGVIEESVPHARVGVLEGDEGVDLAGPCLDEEAGGGVRWVEGFRVGGGGGEDGEEHRDGECDPAVTSCPECSREIMSILPSLPPLSTFQFRRAALFTRGKLPAVVP